MKHEENVPADVRRLVIDAAFQMTARAAAADGNLIEFHWRLFRRLALPPEMSEIELSERRLAFLAGAESTVSFMAQLDGEDLPLIDCIIAECERVQSELNLRFTPAAGNA